MIVPFWVGLDDIDSLVAALDDIDIFGDAGERRRLVGLIDAELRTDDPQARLNPDRATNQRGDLVGIVTAVLNRPRALPVLAKAAGVLAPGQPAAAHLQDLCRQLARREPVLLQPADLMSLFDELAGLTPGRDLAVLLAEATAPSAPPAGARTLRAAVIALESRTSPLALFRFLERLAACATEPDAAAGLRRWIDAHLELVPAGQRADLAALRQRLMSGPPGPDGQPCLTIRMEPVDEDRFSVLAWLFMGGTAPVQNCAPEDTVTRAQARAWLGALIDSYADSVFVAERRARIEFILPTTLLNEPVDGWQVEYGQATHRLGAQYRVAVRPDARSAGGTERLADRWKITSRIIATEHVAGDVAEWLASTSDAEVKARSDRETWAWLAITCPMMASADAAVAAVVDSGAPVAMWVRGNRDDRVRRQVLADVSRARQVDELPDSVWAFRRLGWAAADDVRRDLVLLWDDPTNPPPDGPTLVAPRPRGAGT